MRWLNEREHTEEPGFSNPEGHSRMNVSKEEEFLPFDNSLSPSSLSFSLVSSDSVLSFSPVLFELVSRHSILKEGNFNEKNWNGRTG
jgi:hypothetical protein